MICASPNCFVRVIAVPAAFTLHTGKEHWEPLLRARAIESRVLHSRARTGGPLRGGRATLYNYGHSLIAEPWGAVIARRALGEGIVAARLDLAAIDLARTRIPLARHRRLPFAPAR